MPLETIKNSLETLEKFYGIAISNNYDLEDVDESKAMYEFKEKKKKYCIDSINKNVMLLKSTGWKLSGLNEFEIKNEVKINEILGLINYLDQNRFDAQKGMEIVDQMKLLITQLRIEKKTDKSEKNLQAKQLIINVPELPKDVLPDLIADIEEMKKVFAAECFRSCVILCGRILETALHKKYFDETGFDILEKNPGIGLGNLVAKLHEKNVELDPGITQQIHLVNQVRIFSVHKKKEAFSPTKDQTYAIILYTLSIIGKLFE